MKFFVFAISFLIAASAQAKSSLYNCTANKSWIFFASEMEEIAREGKTPVLLFNEKEEIVGVLTVSPKRKTSFPFDANEIDVEKISLCGTFDVTDFHYTDGPSADLAQWTSTKIKSIEITQDEGLLVLDAKIAAVEKYGTRIDVAFKAYDLLTEIEEFTGEQRKQPDFEKDWGLPKGVGTFHFYVPDNWKLAR